jgi:DNA replication initiation complex subunit (GINS family)
MSDITITYETLYDILRREKSRAELQELDQLFYGNLIRYLKEKKEILRSQEQKDSIFTTIEVQKTRKQIENIQKIIKELYEKRESKIIQLALMNSRSNTPKNDKLNMLNTEKEIYESIIQPLDEFRNDILHNIVLGNSINEKNEPKDLKKAEKPKIVTKEVIFNRKTDKFIGTDLNNYGPFEKGDKAELPIEIAEFMINKKQVNGIKNEDS